MRKIQDISMAEVKKGVVDVIDHVLHAGGRITLGSAAGLWLP